MVGDFNREMIERIITQYVQSLIKGQIHPLGVFLFGSCAKGNPHRYSDIDIAVISDDLTGHPVDDFLRLMQLRRTVDRRIEPHPFRPEDFNEDNPEAAEIMRTGIRII